MFESGDSEKNVVVSIIDDSVPELNEVFCISLVLPNGGAVIGDIPEGGLIYFACYYVCYCVHMLCWFTVCVTILLNDDAFGQFSFDSASLAVFVEEAGEITTSDNGTYTIYIVQRAL